MIDTYFTDKEIRSMTKFELMSVYKKVRDKYKYQHDQAKRIKELQSEKLEILDFTNTKITNQAKRIKELEEEVKELRSEIDRR